MQQPFLITGLPRSRTAWLARAATIEGFSHCCHEPSLAMDCMDELMQYCASRSEPFVGVSDSHLAQILPTIMEIVRPRTLIVLRDLEDVTRSLEARGLSSRNCMAALHNIGAVMGTPLVRTIEYNDLSNSSLLAEAFQWLMPGAPISCAAIEELQKVKIEADLVANRQAWATNEDRRNAMRETLQRPIPG